MESLKFTMTPPFTPTTTLRSSLYENATGQSAHNVTAVIDDDDVIKYVSDEALFYVSVCVTVLSCGLVSIAGIVANIINIIVFVKQGVFSESTNVSLLGLAVSELFSTLTMLWMSVSFAVALANPPGLNWNPMDVMYLTAGWPHTICGLITRSITAYIAFERCFCVVFPFKVKQVFTPRRSFIAMICIFAYYFISYSPVFIMIQFRRVTDPTTNETRVVLHQDPAWITAEKVTANLNLFTLNLGSVSLVLICTAITVSRVKLSSAWRKSMTSVGGTGSSSSSSSNSNPNSNDNHSNNATTTSTANNSKNGFDFDESKSKEKSSNSTTTNKKVSNTKIDKEAKLVKMITLICVIFLICYSPNVVFLVMYSIDIEIRISGEQENLAWVSFAISFLFESFNSCINIVLYYNMSSRFKKEFNILFGREKSV